ncbi:hypothetical protein AB1471_16385 [Jeotgalibacillus marinus]|uniref:Replication protein n=1 Tax=Jeotgalibacillus marinus TaxID=86667 RepID=A0ABV3Q7J6_9BACL
MGDAEDGDLVHVDDDLDEAADGATEVMAYWHIGIRNYVIREF